MIMLTEIKTLTEHSWYDDQGRTQGAVKYWRDNGQLLLNYYCKDNLLHGEFKEWDKDQLLKEHRFYQEDNDITKEVISLVSDTKNITHKEKVIIKLTYGIECIC